jgi:tetratricopeptide (TPR) repeat protein
MMNEPQGSAVSIDPQHPWLGLSSYTEETRAYFHGRDDEAAELARRVQRKNLTVLFGQSGLGKTSLLRAGLVPRLRSEGYCPVYVRVDYSPESPPPAEQIKQAVFKATSAAGHWTRPGTAIEGESLWEFLHHRGDLLRDASGRTLLPLLIFDQFEEIFTLAQADDRGRLRAREFVEELADLVENRPPLALERRLEHDDAAADDFDFARADYRILIALREDYLAHLESLKGTMPSITQNRMRLARMTGAQALSAVMKPGGRLVSQEVAESIVRFVAGGSELANAEVEPSLLSLVCRELNNLRIAKGRAEISADLLAGSRDTILTEFYERALEDQPPGVRRVIEDELLTESGYRESLAEERVIKALAAAGAAPDSLAKLVDRRLLRIEERLDVRRVELTHDVLCSVVRASRDLRHEREARDEAERQLAAQREREAETRRTLRRTRRVAVVSAVLMLIALASSIFGWINYRRAHEADLAAQKARADAEKLVGFLIEDFYAELEPTGRLEIMGKLAHLAVEYYDGLPKELLTPQTQVYRGMALIREGSAYLAADRIEEGTQSIAQAHELFDKLRADGNDGEDVKVGLALALFTPFSVWGPGGGPTSAATDLQEAADLLRPLIEGGSASPQVKILYADILNHSSHSQSDLEQSLAMCEEARAVLAGMGALELKDLTAASVYADTADSQARHALTLGRLEDAAKLEQQVYDIAEGVLVKRPGDIRSMKNRSLAADLLGQIAIRRGDLATAAQHFTRAEQAGEDIVRFNPGDLGSWQYLVRALSRSAELLMQQGRVSDAVAKAQSIVALADDDRLTASLAPMLEAVWFRLAELQMDLGQTEAAEKSFSAGVQAMEEAAAQFPADSPRRVLTMTSAPTEQALLSLRAGRHAAALDQASAVVKRLDDLAAESAQTDPMIERGISIFALHGPLEVVTTAATHLGKYDVAEAAARRHDTLPPGQATDPDLHQAARQVEIARAQVGQGKRAEARATLDPAFVLLRDRASTGTIALRLRQGLAEALYVAALTQADDAAGLAEKRKLLDQASAMLAGASVEARQLRTLRELAEEIATARRTAGG